MFTVPTVRSFLGCIDLRVACLVIAAFRLVVSIIALVVLLFMFVILEDETVEASNLDENDKDSYGFVEFLIAVYIAIAAIIIACNLVTTYWFIQGVTSNKPHKMKYYLWIEVVIIALLVISFIYSLLEFRIERLISAAVESYIFICSNSLYQECLLGEYNENADSATENTAMKLDNVPPPVPVYSNSDEKMSLQQTQPPNSNPFKEQ